MQKMDCQAIGYGYIIIPKALLKATYRLQPT